MELRKGKKGKKAGRVGRGQLSVEFFLVLSIIIAFGILLYNISVEEAGKTKALDAVVSVKSSLDGLANSVDFVTLSGNNSLIRKELFLPSEASCFYFNESANAFYCTVESPYLKKITEKTFVESLPLYSTTKPEFAAGCQPSLAAGWYEFTVKNNGGTPEISCIARD